jgi:hypothetical protein
MVIIIKNFLNATDISNAMRNAPEESNETKLFKLICGLRFCRNNYYQQYVENGSPVVRDTYSKQVIISDQILEKIKKYDSYIAMRFLDDNISGDDFKFNKDGDVINKDNSLLESNVLDKVKEYNNHAKMKFLENNSYKFNKDGDIIDNKNTLITINPSTLNNLKKYDNYIGQMFFSDNRDYKFNEKGQLIDKKKNLVIIDTSTWKPLQCKTEIMTYFIIENSYKFNKKGQLVNRDGELISIEAKILKNVKSYDSEADLELKVKERSQFNEEGYLFTNQNKKIEIIKPKTKNQEIKNQEAYSINQTSKKYYIIFSLIVVLFLSGLYFFYKKKAMKTKAVKYKFNKYNE